MARSDRHDERSPVIILIPADDPQAADPDGFPTARFAELIRRLPRYLRLAWGLAGEPSIPRARRAGVVAAAAYLASPVDLIPGVIPVVGQLDDIAVAVLALRAALRAVDEPTRLRLLAEAGMSQEDLDRDLETAGLAALWLGRQGVRLTRRLARLAATAGVAAARAGGRLAVGAAQGAVRAGRDAAPSVAAGAAGVASAVGRGASKAAGRGASVAGRGASATGQGAAAIGRGVASAGGALGRRLGRIAGRGGAEVPADPDPEAPGTP